MSKLTEEQKERLQKAGVYELDCLSNDLHESITKGERGYWGSGYTPVCMDHLNAHLGIERYITERLVRTLVLLLPGTDPEHIRKIVELTEGQ